MTGVMGSLEFRPGPDLRGDFLLTTELADYLASEGVPFREAHHVAGSLVKLCEQRGVGLDALSLDDLQAAHPAFTPAVFAWLDPEAAAERRRSTGGTAWVEIERQVARLRSLS
jgi:argininosuccinate lyase